MAKYWARSGFEIDMSVPDLSDVIRGRARVVNDHVIKIGYGDGYATTFKGDFDLNKKGQVTGGVISRIEFENDDHYGTTMSGLDVSLVSFLKAAKTTAPTDDTTLFEKIFAKNDEITGGSNDDSLRGFGGDDRLEGNMGADILSGGSGADVFLYSESIDSYEGFGIDTIVDFSQAEGDKISLRDIGLFDFAEDVQISSRGSDTMVEVDVNAQITLIIRVQGLIDLNENDFIL